MTEADLRADDARLVELARLLGLDVERLASHAVRPLTPGISRKLPGWSLLAFYAQVGATVIYGIFCFPLYVVAMALHIASFWVVSRHRRPGMRALVRFAAVLTSPLVPFVCWGARVVLSA